MIIVIKLYFLQTITRNHKNYFILRKLTPFSAVFRQYTVKYLRVNTSQVFYVICKSTAKKLSVKFQKLTDSTVLNA